MTSRREITGERLDQLLAWLGADRNAAAERLEQIRTRLIAVLTYRGCRTPEELADDAIDRVAARAGELQADYQGDPALYFYGVAKNVYRESLRSPKVVPMPPGDLPGPLQEDDESETRFGCLEACLGQLDEGERELVLDYHRGERGGRITRRESLAETLGVSLNALRLRIFRLMGRLRDCFFRCLEDASAA